MKKTLITAIILLFSVSGVFAQNEKYVQTMTSSIEALNNLDKGKPDVSATKEIAGRFEKIAAAGTKEWLPRYYAAYCYVLLGLVGNNLTEKDQFLDKAKTLMKESEIIIGKPTDELSVLMAFEAQIRLAADPENRWQKEGGKFADYLAQAKSINPENPRIYCLEGSSLFFTPEEYGGGKKIARPVLEKAIEKFSKFKPESSISPNWGRVETEWMLSQTNQ